MKGRHVTACLELPPACCPGPRRHPFDTLLIIALFMALELPSEIWEAIFDLATEDERIYKTQLPNAMDRSEWFPRFEGGWIPRGPQEVVNSLQRKGYATKKVSCGFRLLAL
jgi:hypothetical protein